MPDAPPDAAPRWGLGDAGAGWLIGAFLQQLAVSAYLAASDQERYDQISLLAVALLQVPLWVGLAGAPLYAATVKGHGVVEDFGFRFRAADAPGGFALGVATQALLVPLLYLPLSWFVHDLDVSDEARKLTDRAHGPGVAVLVLVVVVGAPVVEELFYRGLLLRSLERRVGATWALPISAVVFGVSHFQLLQLPALVAFGLLLGALAQRTGRLGPGIWAHAGFNAYTVFSLLVIKG